jgi:hypothetical protein
VETQQKCLWYLKHYRILFLLHLNLEYTHRQQTGKHLSNSLLQCSRCSIPSRTDQNSEQKTFPYSLQCLRMNSIIFLFLYSLLPLLSIELISQFLDYLQTVRLLGRVISSSQVRYLNTGQHKHKSNIHALRRIRNHDPGFRASEDSKCLRPLGYRDWRIV